MAHSGSIDGSCKVSYSKLQASGDKSNFKPIEVIFKDGSVYYTSYASFNGSVQNGIYKTIDESMSIWCEIKNPNPDYWNDKEEVTLFLDGLQIKVEGNGKYYASKEYGLFCIYFK